MFSFAIGIFSIIGVLFFLGCYGLNIVGRKSLAWINNKDTKIEEKVWAYSILFIFIGFIIGSLVQGYWNDLKPCVDSLGDIKKCIFDFRQHKSY